MIAAGQSMLAIRVVPSLMLAPVVMKRLVKSSRCSQPPQLMSRLTPASAVRMPSAQARRASARMSRGSFRGGLGG